LVHGVIGGQADDTAHVARQHFVDFPGLDIPEDDAAFLPRRDREFVVFAVDQAVDAFLVDLQTFVEVQFCFTFKQTEFSVLLDRHVVFALAHGAVVDVQFKNENEA